MLPVEDTAAAAAKANDYYGDDGVANESGRAGGAEDTHAADADAQKGNTVKKASPVQRTDHKVTEPSYVRTYTMK